MKRVVGYSDYASAIPPQAASSSAVAAPAGPQPSTPKRSRLSAADVVKQLTLLLSSGAQPWLERGYCSDQTIVERVLGRVIVATHMNC